MKIYSVSEITREVKALLEGNFPEIWVEGEISNFRPHSSGHFYFSLKDSGAQLRTVMFRGANQRLRFKPEEGMAVLCRGRISLYEARGEYQLIVESMEPKGIGALQLAFEQLKKRLQAEGLFEESRKKKLPFLPRRVGIVTSPTGAVIRDMIDVLTRRFPNIQILLCPVAVQGEGAAEQIAEAMGLLNEVADLDLIIVGRGGGSIEDLWAFNEEVVARAIGASRIPVISAVGHETDFTIADFVADLRAPTPSAAAELAVPVKTDLIFSLQQSGHRLTKAVDRNLEHLRLLVTQWKRSLADPGRRLTEFLLRVDHLQERMGSLLQHRVRVLKQEIKGIASQLTSLNPLAILERGYAFATKEGSTTPLTNARQAPVGTGVRITLSKGKLITKVTGRGV